MRIVLSWLLILSGVVTIGFSGFLLWQRNSPTRLSFDLKNTPSQTFSHINPAATLVIPELGIELPIYSAGIHNGKWEASTEGVSHLSSSPAPGEKGNSIIYGHNWTSILGNLTRAKPGQEVSITFAGGDTKTFVIEYTSIVTPDQTHILEPTQDNRVTIYTCTGFLDRKRFVATAFLKN